MNTDEKTLLSVREQIQEDLLALLDEYPELQDAACQIVVDNFKTLETCLDS